MSTFTPPSLAICLALSLSQRGVDKLKGLIPSDDHGKAFNAMWELDYFCAIHLHGEPSQICFYTHNNGSNQYYLVVGRPTSASGLDRGQVSSGQLFTRSYTRKGIPARILALPDEVLSQYVESVKELVEVIKMQHIVTSDHWNLDDETYNWLDMLCKKYM